MQRLPRFATLARIALPPFAHPHLASRHATPATPCAPAVDRDLTTCAPPCGVEETLRLPRHVALQQIETAPSAHPL
eukprot:1336874-Pyramimonas_sp.AAC.1